MYKTLSRVAVISIFGLASSALFAGAALNTLQAQQSTAAAGPCDSANTQMEMNECSQKEFKKADARLNAIYAKLKKALASDKQALGNLRAAQRAWIQYRDLHCSAAQKQFAGGSIAPLILSNCMEETTKHRIDEIKHTYETDARKLE